MTTSLWCPCRRRGTTPPSEAGPEPCGPAPSTYVGMPSGLERSGWEARDVFEVELERRHRVGRVRCSGQHVVDVIEEGRGDRVVVGRRGRGRASNGVREHVVEAAEE